MNDPHIAVLIPCYKRPEYTELCIKSVEEAQGYSNVDFYLVDDGSNDRTSEILQGSSLPNKIVTIHAESVGLRNTIIEFFEQVSRGGYDYITKIDNDCLVPKYWLSDLLAIIQDAKADVLSPNVSETNAARKYGAVHLRDGKFIPSQIVGGLWFMRANMIQDIYFEPCGKGGIYAAFNIIKQIVVEKEPKIGWTDDVTYEDVGYWTGSNAKHIKTVDHAIYSKEIGRPIAWQPEDLEDYIGQTNIQD